MFDKLWFRKYQKILLWLCNTPLISIWFRNILRIHKNGSSVGKRTIKAILPNAIIWAEQGKTYWEFRTHDKFAKRLYYAFRPLWQLSHIWDMRLANNFAPQWNLGFDSFGPYYSNAGGDGNIEVNSGTWSTAHDATSGTSAPAAAAGRVICAFISGTTYYVGRAFLPFDTSGLDDTATISGAVLSIYETDHHGTDETYVVVQSTQASNTSLADGDFDALGTTSGGSILSSGMTTNAYNDIALNATGIGWISKTDYTPLAIRGQRDINNTAPTTWEDTNFNFSDQAGTANDPKLVVTTSTTAVSTGYAYFL